jgi:hypothetical protein
VPRPGWHSGRRRDRCLLDCGGTPLESSKAKTLLTERPRSPRAGSLSDH